MKKNKWKGALALGLAVTMMATSLAGCTKKGGDKQGGQGGSDFPAVTSETAKQNVYRYTEVPIGEEDTSINCIRKIGDRIEVITQAYSWDEYGEKQTITLVSMDLQGGDKKSVEMYTEVNEATFPFYGDMEPVYFDMPEGEQLAPHDESEDTLEEESDLQDGDGDEDYEGDFDFDYGDYSYENTYYQNATIAQDCVYAIKNHSVEHYENEEYVSENEYSLVCWDKSGNEKFVTSLDISKYQNEDTYAYVSDIFELKDGKVGVLLRGDVYGMFVIDKDGTASGFKKFGQGAAEIFNSDPNLMDRGDGTFIVSYYNEEWTKMFLTTYDPETEKVGEKYEVPTMVRNLGMYELYRGLAKDIIFSGTDGVYTINLGDSEATKVMDFINSDLATYEVSNIVCIDETHFVATYYDSTTYNTNLAFFSYVKPEDIKDKKALVYAGMYIDSYVKSQIINFNKTDADYRISIRDYSIYNTEEDYNAGLTKFNNDLIAGNIPDIICIDTSMPLESYVAKGMLVDIDEMIKNDAELSKIEFMDNVFEAYRQNGKLYTVIPNFIIRTWVAKKSMVGDRTSLTMADVNQLKNNLTGEKSIFGLGMTRESFIETLMSYGGADFIDVTTGKCNFNTQHFVELLEYAKTLPTNDEAYDDYDEDYWNNYWESYQSQYRENKSLLLDVYMSDVSNIKYMTKGMLGEEGAFIGFPTENGNGSYIQLSNAFAISAKSENKDGAWKFLRVFLTEDYQKNDDSKYGYMNGMPVIKSYVRDMVDQLKQRPYWIDFNGEKIEYDDTYYLNGQEVILQPFTQGEADRLFDFICSVKTPAFANNDIMKIVTEETDAFFANSTSAKDAAANIQNRVQLYVNENR